MNDIVTRSVKLSRESDAELRRLIKRKHWKYSEFVEDAVERALQRMRVDELLEEAEAESGPIAEELREEARQKALDLIMSWRSIPAQSSR